jgi:hypothetical protein
VAEVDLNGLGVSALGNQKRGARVTHIVDPKVLREAGCLQRRDPRLNI